MTPPSLRPPSAPHAEAAPSAVDLTRQGFRRRDVMTSVGRTALFEAGDGPPLLLLHGIGGGASSYYWSRVAPLLTGGHRVVAPDLVGWGASEHPDHPVLFDTYAAQVEDLLEELGPDVVVVAQSLLAGVSAAVAVRRPGSVAGLAMLAPTGGKDFGEDQFGPVVRATLSRAAGTPVLGEVLYRAVFHRRAAIARWFTSRGFLDPSAVPDDVVDAGHASARRSGASRSALPFLSGELRFDISPYLRALPVPAVMLWGEQEQQIPAWVRARLERLNPAIGSVRIAGARSNMELEQPEQVAAVIRRFSGPPVRHVAPDDLVRG